MMGQLAFFGSSMGPGEIALIGVVLLLLFGAERLPGIARAIGKAMNEFRRAARDVQQEILADRPGLPGPDASASRPDTDLSRPGADSSEDRAG